MTPAHDGRATAESTGLTRRQALKVGAATFVGYAVGVDKAGPGHQDRHRRPRGRGPDGRDRGLQHAGLRGAPPPARAIRSSCSPRSGASTSGSRTSRAGSPRRAITVWPRAVPARGRGRPDPQRPGHPEDRPRRAEKQLLGDIEAAIDWAEKRPGARPDKVGITGFCWGGGVVYQVAATNPDIDAAVAWYGSFTCPFVDTPNPVAGFDVAKDIKVPFLGLYGRRTRTPSPRTPGSSSRC